MKRVNTIIWGLCFIAIALAIIFTSTGIIGSRLGIWSIILTCVSICIMISSVLGRSVVGFLVGIGIFWIALQDTLGLPHLSVWIIILLIILLSIGIHMIFPKRHTEENKEKYAAYEAEDKVGEKQTVDYNDTNGFIYCRNKFGALSRYINTQELKGADIENSFGSLKIYFDGASVISSPVTVNIHNSFGETQLYFPKEWKIIINVSVFAGDVVPKGRVIDNGDVIVNLNGNVSFGSIVVNHV